MEHGATGTEGAFIGALNNVPVGYKSIDGICGMMSISTDNLLTLKLRLQ